MLRPVEPLSRGRLLGFRVASAVLGVLGALIATEMLLAVFDVGPKLNVIYQENFRLSDDPALGYEWVPGSPDGSLTISRGGLRDREFAVPKPEGTFRIAVLGDSVTASFSLGRWQTYPKQLESLLEKYASGNTRYEVLNLGVVGYNAPQAVASLRARAEAFEPDRVIYGYVLNDPLPSHLIAESLAALEADARLQGRAAAARRVGRLLSRSRLYALLRPPTIPSDAQVSVDWQAPLAAAARDGDPVAYLRELHADPVAWRRVAQALAELATARPDTAVVAIFPIRWSNAFASYPLVDLHERVMAEARRHGLATLDLTPALTAAGARLRNADLYDDRVHPNAAGNRAVAMALLQWLSQSGWLPGGDRPFDRALASEGPDARLAEALDQPDPAP